MIRPVSLSSNTTKPVVMNVVPGKSVGKYQLYQPIGKIIEIIENSHSPSEVIFSKTNTTKHYIVIRILEDGIVLKFDPISHLLVQIIVSFSKKSSSSHVALNYAKRFFTGPSVESSFIRISDLFGPTVPGSFFKEKLKYLHRYPGLHFVFPIPAEFASIYENNPMELPARFPNNTTPIVEKIIVCGKEDLLVGDDGGGKKKKNIVGISDAERGSDDWDDLCYYQEIVCLLKEGIEMKKLKVFVRFQDTVQDVLMKLGKPEGVYYKKYDKLKIHAGPVKVKEIGGKQDEKDPNGIQNSHVDYFFNYFKLGIDIMFCGNEHQVKKIFLHTNMPGTKEFNIYRKANFKLSIKQLLKSSQLEFDIDADSKFTAIQLLLKPQLGESRPIVNNSSVGSNPFGVTRFYGYDGCIFEILSNDHISSLCLFSE